MTTDPRLEALTKVRAHALQLASAVSDMEGGEKMARPEMIQHMNQIDSAINISHVLLKYVADAHAAGKSLDYAMPAIQTHIDALDSYAGSATSTSAKAAVKAILDFNAKED